MNQANLVKIYGFLDRDRNLEVINPPHLRYNRLKFSKSLSWKEINQLFDDFSRRHQSIQSAMWCSSWWAERERQWYSLTIVLNGDR